MGEWLLRTLTNPRRKPSHRSKDLQLKRGVKNLSGPDNEPLYDGSLQTFIIVVSRFFLLQGDVENGNNDPPKPKHTPEHILAITYVFFHVAYPPFGHHKISLLHRFHLNDT